MWVEYYTLPKGRGICCEHCGTYIQNVNVIHFDNGFTLKCGSECFDKLIKRADLSEYGLRVLKRIVSSLKRYDEMASDWSRWKTPEEAEADGCSQRIEDPDNPGTWRIRTQEEFTEERGFMLNQFLPAQIKRRQEEMKDKFKNVHIPRT
ncbi:hypothetical protein [Caproiciproducens sp. CPB-2]|uniref:hypothetical protein n=1 Tax=Caproiciproducens sp. CPB-2 TaxID=3030017 RepID=UPI0023D988C6|nr:hypothetical protein [Caproiciproducens sp. CPB-2]MDF1495474.1 hypothetical protein [Caproiciproducens sp. CPB-2]